MNTYRIEADVYRRLHKTRDEHNNLARRARQYQADLDIADREIGGLVEASSNLFEACCDMAAVHRREVDVSYLRGALLGTFVTAASAVFFAWLWSGQ